MVFPVPFLCMSWHPHVQVPQWVGVGVVEEEEGEEVDFASMVAVWHGLMAPEEIPMGVEVEHIGMDLRTVGDVVGQDNHMVRLRA